MEKKEPEPGARQTAMLRRFVSLLLVIHFFAILTAVTSHSTWNFPAPALAVKAHEPVRPYLQLTALDNPYRFFAPNPGIPTVLWFRVQYADRSVRWLEVPRRSDSWTRELYQRCLNLTIALGQQMVSASSEPAEVALTEIGQTCLASHVRHVAGVLACRHPDGKTIPAKSIGVYCLQHRGLSPEEARAGWEQIDLRTYQAVFLGAYTADGVRVDELGPRLIRQPIAYVAAGILKIDVYPLYRQEGEDRLRLIQKLDLPMPMHRLLEKHPELQNPDMAQHNLQSRIEQVISGR